MPLPYEYAKRERMRLTGQENIQSYIDVAVHIPISKFWHFFCIFFGLMHYGSINMRPDYYLLNFYT